MPILGPLPVSRDPSGPPALPKGAPMTQHDTALPPAAELRANAALPFGQAVAMPKSVYTSADFADLEQRHIFARDWLCAGGPPLDKWRKMKAEREGTTAAVEV